MSFPNNENLSTFAQMESKIKQYNLLTEISKEHIDDVYYTLKNCLEKGIPFDNINDVDANGKIQCRIIIECCKFFRNNCAKGSLIQNEIVKLPGIFELIIYLLDSYGILNSLRETLITIDPVVDDVQKFLWQFMANLCVMNEYTQEIIWQKLNKQLFEYFEILHNNLDICTMILYNITIARVSDFSTDGSISKIFHQLLDNYFKLTKLDHQNVNYNTNYPNQEFLYIFLDYFLTKYPEISGLYHELDVNRKLYFVHYVSFYLDALEDRSITEQLVNTICFDKIWNPDDISILANHGHHDNLEVKTNYIKLNIIYQFLTNNQYKYILIGKHCTLFNNTCALLEKIHKLGKESENNFTPIRKLEMFAPNSKENLLIQQELTFEIKTLLIKIICNFVHQNAKYQNMARESNVILTIFDCTTMDARNPLIKEWSIFAIRNLCENNEENQKMIASLTRQGDGQPVPSDVLDGFNINFSSLQL